MTDGRLRTVGRWALAVALALSLAVVAVVAVPGIVGAEASYVVLSDSMDPAFGAGDVVVVRATDPANVGVGDVITYHSPTAAAGSAEPVSHRVVEVDRSGAETTFVTKGDANEATDPYTVSESDLVGSVWFVIPFVGHLIHFAGTTVGILTLVVLPGVVLAVTEVWSLYRDATVPVKESQTDA